ncbi:class I SAM-dependent methyltransferase [Phytoactinopolyspora halotolerans]|uniref:Class I SAM-dependent methyltransferase n=2 Tax=Phytoactinopolyspora halotolerans TaxID=1981512 RepID=A0A6L9S9P6_9ACTN|nr:class I SAM-dependent methyltransferase [Phytoactinopolyspora halotolerans]
MTARWMVDEHAYAGPEHLDAEFAAGYDRKQGYPDAADDVAVLRRHGVGERSTVIDFGAGTGQFALAAAEAFGRVVAVDVSPIMLSRLSQAASDGELRNVECVQAGFLSYEHAGPPAEAVFTRNALHHLPDFFKAVALTRIAGMVPPGGVLRLHDLIYDFRPEDADAIFQRWFDGAVDDPAVGYTAADYLEHIQTEYSTFRWLLEPMLDVAGFDIADVTYSGSVFGAYTCIRRPS